MEDNSAIRAALSSVLDTCNLNTQHVSATQDSLLQVLRTLSEELSSLSSLPTIEKEKLIARYMETAGSLKKRLQVINGKMEKIQGRVDKIEKRSMKALE